MSVDRDVLRTQPFQNLLTSPNIIRFGTMLNLLTETHIGTPVGLKKAIHIRLHPNNINRDSGIEIPEEWTPTIKQTTADRYHSGLVKNSF